jgi:hypothetical protein
VVPEDRLGRVLEASAPLKQCRRDDEKGIDMNTRQEEHSMRRAWTRAGLLFLAATTLNGSLWALPFPRSFYEDFPLRAGTGSLLWGLTMSTSCGTTAL